MELKYNVTGSERKSLVSAISTVLDTPTNYLGAPSFAYEVGGYHIDKNGTVSFDDLMDSDEIERLIEALCEKGFEAEAQEVTDGLCIELPLKDISETAVENLRRMTDSKAALIKKALGAERLDIELTDDTIRFPWFDRIPEPEVISAAAHLIGKLLVAAKAQKRVTAKEKETDNEKYAFRCFLLRLGFIGAEYKEERKILLKNLSGSSAFKTGQKKGFSQDDLDKAKADPAVRAEIKAILGGNDDEQ